MLNSNGNNFTLNFVLTVRNPDGIVGGTPWKQSYINGGVFVVPSHHSMQIYKAFKVSAKCN